MAVGRIWSCLTVAIYPIINAVMNMIVPEPWQFIELYVALFLLLGGLFIPLYIVGKKYG